MGVVGNEWGTKGRRDSECTSSHGTSQSPAISPRHPSYDFHHHSQSFTLSSACCHRSFHASHLLLLSQSGSFSAIHLELFLAFFQIFWSPKSVKHWVIKVTLSLHIEDPWNRGFHHLPSCAASSHFYCGVRRCGGLCQRVADSLSPAFCEVLGLGLRESVRWGRRDLSLLKGS